MANNENDDMDSALPQEFHTNNWPAVHDAVKDALREIAASRSHRVVPIPAYDMHGKLIWPVHYRSYLEDAVVVVCFNLRHWSIKRSDKDSTDAYVADVVQMRVLVPPKLQGPVTPRKRRILPTDPFSPETPPSVGKKRR